MNAIQIIDRINQVREQAAQAASEGRTEDALRLGGQLDELNAQLEDAIRREDAARAVANTLGGATPEWRPRNVAQAFLGPRDQFAGVRLVPEDGLTNITDAVSGLPTPIETDRDIPALQLLSAGFVDSLAKGRTDGDIRYMQAGTYTNAAAAWTEGTNKPESSYTWVEQTAHMQIIAHQTPVSVFALKHYGQLESVITNELMVGLRNAEDVAALFANNANTGIVGVTQTADAYTPATNDNLYDTIVKMKARSLANTGIAPTHVAVAPEVATALELLKTNGGEYLRLYQGGRIAGLEVVEDVNLSVTVQSTTSAGILVYNANAATWFTAEENEVLMGVIDKQFIQNARTMLAEGEHALKVTHPKSFVYAASVL